MFTIGDCSPWSYPHRTSLEVASFEAGMELNLGNFMQFLKAARCRNCGWFPVF